MVCTQVRPIAQWLKQRGQQSCATTKIAAWLGLCRQMRKVRAHTAQHRSLRTFGPCWPLIYARSCLLCGAYACFQFLRESKVSEWVLKYISPSSSVVIVNNIVYVISIRLTVIIICLCDQLQNSDILKHGRRSGSIDPVCYIHVEDTPSQYGVANIENS